ncbi:MAG: methyltransferase domain-containing protein [Proteobacteria bacterium]|nr:methyltransferase domain-containing protein [Pseudomonadota bacterium]
MNILTKDKWDKHYNSCANELTTPAEVLFHNQHLLPAQGTALDLACGRGANAICLAENGLTVTAWDISSSALEHLSNNAKEKGLTVNSEFRDLSKHPPESDSFDIIVVSRFLDRDIIPDIHNAIKSDGLIFYQTFIKDKVNETGPNNPDYLLDKNELLTFFKDWKIIFYREEGQIGNVESGFRNQAMLIAQKPCAVKP